MLCAESDSQGWLGGLGEWSPWGHMVGRDGVGGVGGFEPTSSWLWIQKCMHRVNAITCMTRSKYSSGDRKSVV